MNSKYMQSLRIDNRSVRRSVSSRSSKRFLIFFLLGLLLVSGMIFSGWVRWKQTEIVYRINKNRETTAALREENKKLQSRLHELRAPGRADDIARRQLGMSEIDPDRIIIVEPSGERSGPVGSNLAASSADGSRGGQR